MCDQVMGGMAGPNEADSLQFGSVARDYIRPSFNQQPMVSPYLRILTPFWEGSFLVLVFFRQYLMEVHVTPWKKSWRSMRLICDCNSYSWLWNTVIICVMFIIYQHSTSISVRCCDASG